MATTKKAGATKRPSPRVPSPLKAVAKLAPPAPAADGRVTLVFRGGADLSFRDGSGTKRRVLRGVPFLVDTATAELLLATDSTVGVHNRDETGGISSVPVPAPVQLVPAGSTVIQGGNTPADDPAVDATGEAGTPPSTEPVDTFAGDMPSGAITLGDLPRGAVKGRN